MALALAELLKENVETIAVKNTDSLAQHVSDELAADYARLSPAIYDLAREITVAPENSAEVIERFNLDVRGSFDLDAQGNAQGKTFKISGPKTTITLPLIVLCKYDEKTKQISCQGTTRVDYEMKFEEKLPRPETWHHTSNDLSVYGGEHSCHINSQYGTQNISVSVKGTWTYKGKVESIIVKVPPTPEKIMDLEAEAQLRYFQVLTEAKRSGYFPGQTLSQPEIYLLWIPREEDFELKVEKMEIVHPDPALILRVDRKHDHVIGLWQTQTEVPLEFLVRRHSKKK